MSPVSGFPSVEYKGTLQILKAWALYAWPGSSPGLGQGFWDLLRRVLSCLWDAQASGREGVRGSGGSCGRPDLLMDLSCPNICFHSLFVLKTNRVRARKKKKKSIRVTHPAAWNTGPSDRSQVPGSQWCLAVNTKGSGAHCSQNHKIPHTSPCFPFFPLYFSSKCCMFRMMTFSIPKIIP